MHINTVIHVNFLFETRVRNHKYLTRGWSLYTSKIRKIKEHFRTRRIFFDTKYYNDALLDLKFSEEGVRFESFLCHSRVHGFRAKRVVN